MKFALQYHAVNERNSDEWTPLHNAASNGQIDACKLLLSQPGIDLNPTNNHNETPLDLAIKKGYQTVIDYLRQNGCVASSPPRQNRRKYYNSPPKALSPIDELKNLKPNPSNFNSIYKIVDNAILNQDANTIRFAIENEYMKVQDTDKPFYNNVALEAAFRGGRDFIIFLEVCGYNPKNDFFLHKFAQIGDVEGVEYALKFHDINEKGENWWTPLHYAVDRCQMESCKLLLSKQGIEKNQLNQKDETPLDLANRVFKDETEAEKNARQELVDFLKSQGCQESIIKPIIIDDEQKEPLNIPQDLSSIQKLQHVPKEPRNFDMIFGILLDSYEKNDHETIEYAVKNDYLKLTKAGDRLTNIVIEAATKANLKFIQYLEKYGYSPKDDFILHEFSYIGDVEGMKFALQYHNVNERDGGERTALHIAASSGQIDACKLLLSQPEIDKNPTNNRNEMPLDLAIKNDNQTVIDYLISNGCEETQKTLVPGQVRIHVIN
ncbi:hypothetical protein TVAG_148660 [Trichomonas vaginalis G3]|uniref:Ankyrin repeat protein n=1 Tax=Trichomonas vaginalis (strain ATCC PRA-98 / G3) TaxID=412133 RepID=A2FF10_TRIV3|nr:temperature-gated cation channel protein [Trichomonas vaginalis G3]EAX96514.1 hypothetical protein TVAG_148660 [Trichomonas vaginalis G3]KAI5506495.1 temperature-gated cation channel protein [Trichomonas vaginalis G3]|eukprot:XP_001309444.1 hypothetical protein [Trichomonas vaginalis G3]